MKGSNYLIKTKDLSKTFGSFCALSDVSITISPGQVIGLAGPNGGGKTTLIKCLLGLETPDVKESVRRKIEPKDQVAYRRQVAYAPDTDDLLPLLTGREYLGFVAVSFGLDQQAVSARAFEILDELAFDADKLDEYINNYSHGMRKKIQLASVLALDLPLVILDEPTNGLDPSVVIKLKSVVKKRTNQQKAFLLCSHNLGFIESIADECYLLNKEVLAKGSIHTLLDHHGASSLEGVYAKCIQTH